MSHCWGWSMAGVTLYEYAQIADQVYNDQSAFVLAGWVC